MTNSFVLLLALGVVATGSTSSKSSTQTGTDAKGLVLTGSQEVPASTSTGYQTILEKYLGPNSDPKELCESPVEGKKNVVHALIGTLPDPSDPHLADTFDNYLGSIQLALAKDGYLADQYWLPEVMRRKEQAKNRLDLPQPFVVAPVGQRDPVNTLTSVAAKPEADLLDEPGILLFRKQPQKDTPDELLFLLLVPETPTGGVRQAALRAALERAASPICPQGTAAADATIRIIGPSFSGTAASLARGIERWQRTSEVHVDSSHIEIISGSATNFHTRDFLKQVAKFSATVTPDDVMNDFYQYLAEKFTPDRPVIAIFTESNTSYGQAAFSIPKDQVLPNTSDDQAKSDTSDGQVHKKQEKPKPRILDLYFPLHVSQLGAEYEKSRTQKAVAALPEGDARLLSLNLLEQDEPSDVAPAMSALTKYNADLSLVNSLMAIDRAHLHVVGIRATDPRDELFLARKIKQIVPDAQLFLMDSELLFSHTALAKEMRGALVVSRYPLFNLNQLWTPPRQMSPRVQFVSGSSQGVYNAAILQLRKFDQERQGKPASAKLEPTDSMPTPVNTAQRPFIDGQQNPESEKPGGFRPDDLPKPLEYGQPFELQSSRPLLWVGMVGHYGIWPIGTIGEGKSGSLKEYVGKSEVKWDEVKKYTAEFLSDDKPMQLVYPYGVLHSLATLLLLLIILWHAAQALTRWMARWKAPPSDGSKNLEIGGEHPLVCSAPANIPRGSGSALGYAAVQVLGWQSLIAIYLVAVAPIVATRMAAVTLSAQKVAKPMEWESWAVLIVGFVSGLICSLIGGVLGARVLWRSIKRALYGPRDFELVTQGFCGILGAVLLGLSAVYFLEVALVSLPATQVFLWVRSANWLSGISPMLPMVFLGAAIYATTWLNLYRLAIASTNTDPQLAHFTAPLQKLLPGGELKDAEDAADDVALGRSLVGWRWLVLLALPTVAMVVLFNIRQSAEPTWWTWLVRVLLGMLILGMVHGLVLLVQLWRTTSKTLDQLAGHPVLDVLKGMQHELAAMVGLHPYAAAPRRDQVLACERAQLNALKQWAARQAQPTPPQEAKELQGINTLQEGVTWASENLNKNAWPAGKKQPAWSRSAAKLVALEVVRALGRRVAVIRALIGILTIDAFALLMVTQIYPFQPHSLLSGLSWFLLLAVVIVSAWALVTMERSAVLSYASGSEPGKVTWDASFVLHLALFVGLPLAALVAAHFPEIGGPIFESLQPLIRSAR